MLVTPAGPFQTFRLSIGDLSYLICDTRHSYNAENSRLSRSATILPPDQLDVLSVKDDVDGPLGMGLITVVTLDSMVALVTTTSTVIAGKPKASVGITCGQLCLYGCKDSFTCFSDTLSELILKLTALPKSKVQAIKSEESAGSSRDTSQASAKNTVEAGVLESGDIFYDSRPGENPNLPNTMERQFSSISDGSHTREVGENDSDGIQQLYADLSSIDAINPEDLDAMNEQNNPMVPTVPTVAPEEFTLDGYDWTTVDHDWSKEDLPPGEEQVARWYPRNTGKTPSLGVPENQGNSQDTVLQPPVRIDPHYLAMKSAIDVMSEGDMGAAKHAGLTTAPFVTTRLLLRNLNVRIRFFDGYDWPDHTQKAPKEKGKQYVFLIDEPDLKIRSSVSKIDPLDHKSRLMTALLDGESAAPPDTFLNIPTAEERGEQIRRTTERKRLARKTNRSIQISLSGMKCRVDSFTESVDHRLASCTDLQIDDMFISESVSQAQPIKLMGEWVSEKDHPRDTSDGLISLKVCIRILMVRWYVSVTALTSSLFPPRLTLVHYRWCSCRILSPTLFLPSYIPVCL